MANRHSFRKSVVRHRLELVLPDPRYGRDEGLDLLRGDLFPDVEQVRDLDVDDLRAQGARDAGPVELVVVHPPEHVPDHAEAQVPQHEARPHGVEVPADLRIGIGVRVGAHHHLVAGEDPHLPEGAGELGGADHRAVAQGLLVVALEVDVPVALAQEDEQRRVLDVAQALHGDHVDRVGEHHEYHQVDRFALEEPPRRVRLVHGRHGAGPHDAGLRAEGLAQVVHDDGDIGVDEGLERPGVHAVVLEVRAGVDPDLEGFLLPRPVQQVAVLVLLGHLERFDSHPFSFPTGTSRSRRAGLSGSPA